MNDLAILSAGTDILSSNAREVLESASFIISAVLSSPGKLSTVGFPLWSVCGPLGLLATIWLAKTPAKFRVKLDEAETLLPLTDCADACRPLAGSFSTKAFLLTVESGFCPFFPSICNVCSDGSATPMKLKEIKVAVLAIAENTKNPAINLFRSCGLIPLNYSVLRTQILNFFIHTASPRLRSASIS